MLSKVVQLLSEAALPKPLPITCPTCRSVKIRRSKRRTLMDYLLSSAGILPWRCESCELRFQSRPVPFRFSLYAHCSYCGNADLQRISPEHVPGWTAFFGRITGLPSLRCDPCRHKFFSMRPLMPQEHLVVPTAE
jgi:hypothetical protein